MLIKSLLVFLSSLVGVFDLIELVFGLLNLRAQKGLENSLFKLFWSEGSAVRSGYVSLSVGESSHSSVAELLKSGKFGFRLQHWLDTFLSFFNVLGCESATWGSDFSYLVGSCVVRLSSVIGNSVGCHCFIIYSFKFIEKSKVKSL